MLTNYRTGFLTGILSISSLFMMGVFCTTSLHAAPKDDNGFNVVQIIDKSGEIRHEIVESDIIPYLKKELDQEYKVAMKEWNAARKAWKAEHGKTVPFVCPKPIKPSFKVVAKKLSSRSQAKIEKEAVRSQGPYCVIQVKWGDRDERPEIVLKSEVTLKKFAVEMDYFNNIQDWVRQKKEFVKANPDGAFEKTLPEKPQLKILKSSLKTLEKANAYLSKYDG